MQNILSHATHLPWWAWLWVIVRRHIIFLMRQLFLQPIFYPWGWCYRRYVSAQASTMFLTAHVFTGAIILQTLVSHHRVSFILRHVYDWKCKMLPYRFRKVGECTLPENIQIYLSPNFCKAGWRQLTICVRSMQNQLNLCMSCKLFGWCYPCPQESD